MIQYSTNNAIRMGVEKSSLKNWASNRRKGKIAIKGIVANLMTLEEYMNLPDGGSCIYNNKLMVAILSQVNGTKEYLETSHLNLETIVRLSKFKGSKRSKDIFLKFARKLNIDEGIIEEYETQFNKGSF